MVPNPTKSIIAETQARLTDIIRELEKNLSRLIMLVGDKAISASVERYTITGDWFRVQEFSSCNIQFYALIL